MQNKEEAFRIQTVKCHCIQCEHCADTYVTARKREKRFIIVLIICLVFVFILCCITLYLISIVLTLNSSYIRTTQSINRMNMELSILNDKTREMAKQLKVSETTGFQSYRPSLETRISNPNVQGNSKASSTVEKKFRRVKRETDVSWSQMPSRQKRAKRHKRCKNCLPAIQIEGSGGLQHSKNKFAMDGVWIPSAWPKEYHVGKKAFHTSRVGRTGLVSVKKSGLYLLYAQVTLTGERKRGFKILRKRRDGNESTVAVCRRHLIQDDLSESDSCCTLKIVLLNEGDGVFVREDAENTGANYSKSHSFFGLIRLGTL